MKQQIAYAVGIKIFRYIIEQYLMLTRGDQFDLKINLKKLDKAVLVKVQINCLIEKVTSLNFLCKINFEKIDQQIRSQFSDLEGFRVIICVLFCSRGGTFKQNMFDRGLEYIIRSQASKTIFKDTDIVGIFYEDQVPRQAIEQILSYIQKRKIAAVIHGAVIRLKNTVVQSMKQVVVTPKKFILITGGSRGIGKCAVEILASTRNNIILTTRKVTSNLLSWVQHLKSIFKVQIQVMELSQRDQQSCQKLAQSIKRLEFLLSGVVHNAAVGTASCLEQVRQNQNFQETLIEVNSIGPVQLQFELQKANLIDQGCRITIVSSVGGNRPIANMNTIDNCSKCVLDEWAAQLSKRYQLLIIYPGATDTDMFRSSTLDKMNQAQLDDFVQKLPKKMLIEPEMIGELIAMGQSQTISPYLSFTKIVASCGLEVDFRPWEGKKN